MPFFSISGPSWLKIKEPTGHESPLHRNIPRKHQSPRYRLFSPMVWSFGNKVSFLNAL